MSRVTFLCLFPNLNLFLLKKKHINKEPKGTKNPTLIVRVKCLLFYIVLYENK